MNKNEYNDKVNQALAGGKIVRLKRENKELVEVLEALLKTEWTQLECDDYFCPYCGNQFLYSTFKEGKHYHEPDCAYVKARDLLKRIKGQTNVK